MKNLVFRTSGLLTLVSLVAGISSQADEGMWLYNQPPRALLKERYGFEPSAAWFEHLRKSSVNVGGASGAFVSAEGLLLSNHHVVRRFLHRMSTEKRNIVRDGFYAKDLKDELPCPGLEISVLLDIEDVTDRVNSAVQPAMSDEAAFLARRATTAAIEKESQDRTGLRSQVVTLFQGGQYHLYRSKRYTDVRLVFAPEEQIAFFGGDVDNFEFPRYNLDIALVRAYENGHPARIEHYLPLSTSGPAEGESVFMSGHPARTDRLRTVAELKYMRDIELPRALQRLKRTEVLLAAYEKRGFEQARRVRADIRGVENGRKARDGMLAALLDPEIMVRKEAEEARLRSAAAASSELVSARDAWDRIAVAQREIASKAREYDLLEREAGFNTPLFTHARRLLRAAAERQKAEGDRLEEYRASSLPSIELALAAEQPCYTDLETLKLADSLTYLVEQFGAEHPVSVKVLAGKSPRARAAECISNTKLGSAAVRKKIYAEGVSGPSGSDPMIELARVIDDDAREVRSAVETQTEAIRQAHAQIGKVRYTVRGSTQYPDATGTLRLAFGTVKGIPETDVASKTTYAGLYKRAEAQGFRTPFDLPQRWIKGRRKLDLGVPFNFISTCDTLGGNSGSPVVNARGELVGVVFDGNIHSLMLDIAYDDTLVRSVTVDSSGILEALRRIYKADRLLRELHPR